MNYFERKIEWEQKTIFHLKLDCFVQITMQSIDQWNSRMTFKCVFDIYTIICVLLYFHNQIKFRNFSESNFIWMFSLACIFAFDWSRWIVWCKQINTNDSSMMSQSINFKRESSDPSFRRNKRKWVKGERKTCLVYIVCANLLRLQSIKF